MLIEMLGAPGAGKSTLIRALLPAIRDAGVPTRRAEKLAGLESADPDAPRYLKRGSDRVALYRNLAFRRENPDLMEHVERKLSLDAADIFLFSWTTNLYVAAEEHGPKRGFTFLDEGLIHRGVSAHLNEASASFVDFLALVPLPDVILNLCPPSHLALERAVARRAHKGFSRIKVEAKFGDEQAFRKRSVLTETAVERLRARGACIVDVDTTVNFETCVAGVVPKLLELRQAHLAHDTAAE